MTLEARLNNVINSPLFAGELEARGIDLFELQCGWPKANGDFTNLPKAHQEAIEATERQLDIVAEVVEAIEARFRDTAVDQDPACSLACDEVMDYFFAGIEYRPKEDSQDETKVE